MNLTDPIWRACHAWPERVAVRFRRSTVSFGRMRQTVGQVCARLLAAGVAPGDVVALALANPLAELLVTLAVVRMGAVITPFKLHWTPAVKQDLLARNAVRFLISDARAADPAAEAAGVRSLNAQELLAPRRSDAPAMPVPAVVQGLDAQPWRLALSSGTTGVPKTIPQTHAEGALSQALVASTTPGEPARLMVFADLAIGVAIAEALCQLVAGRELVLAHDLAAPVFFDIVRRERPTRLVTTTGNAAYLVEHANKASAQEQLDCSSLVEVLLAGSAVAPALRAGIARHLRGRLDVAYGSTEAGRLATLTPDLAATHPLSAGRLQVWVQAQAFDEEGRALPPGRSGVLGFRSPTVFPGYLKDPVATAAALREGWFFPGDRGSVDAAGVLTLQGRVDDVLNLGGKKLDPSRIEQVLDAHPSIRESAVVGVVAPAGNTVLVAVVVADAPFDEAELRRLCRSRLGADQVPRRIVAIGSLPRNEGGKIMRRALAAQLKFSPFAAARDGKVVDAETEG